MGITTCKNLGVEGEQQNRISDKATATNQHQASHYSPFVRYAAALYNAPQ